LHFLRDIDGREVDFLVTESGEPWFAVEVKSSTTDVSKHLSYFANRLSIPHLYQAVDGAGVDIQAGSVRIISMDKFLLALV